MPGILDCHDELPPFPIHGMLSSKGSKVRLTFKLETDEVKFMMELNLIFFEANNFFL